MSERILYTIGHSNHSAAEFLALLKAHGIRQLVDIRRHPGSRRLPHFNRPLLARQLAQTGIGYHWLGEALGGRRAATAAAAHSDFGALPAGALRHFAAHMRSAEFRSAVDELLQIAVTPTVLMCAEGDPARCHRSLLADYLQLNGHAVRHILTDAAAQPHTTHPAAAREGEALVYRYRGQGRLALD